MTPRKKYWYHVIVECTSRERFSVIAASEKEAIKLYKVGDALLRDDEVLTREIVHVRQSLEVAPS